MGVWNTSITGNDIAQDLTYEYRAAFSSYAVENALQIIDVHIRREWFDESNSYDWCSYYYSLADFMWKHGILTENVKSKAIEMIDNGFGLDAWAESGEKILKERKKVLAKFKEKLNSQQPASKKIKLNFYLSPIFKTGDIVAFKLKTSDKTYLKDKSLFDESFFRGCDGKYVVVRKVDDNISYRSSIVPSVADHWAVFQLYAAIFDECPSVEELANIPWAKTEDSDALRRNESNIFTCESSILYFNRRKYKVISNSLEGIEDIINKYNKNYIRTESIFFGHNNSYSNADTSLLNAILK